MPIQKLAEELHKPIIRKSEKPKVYLYIVGNVWGCDLVDVKLISKVNKRIKLLLCVIDIYSKYPWILTE